MELTSTNRSRAYPTDFEYGAQAKIHKSHRKQMLLLDSNFGDSQLSYPVLRVQATLEASTTFGDDGEREPRVPISNTTVKPFSADGTWTAGSWESRTLPST